MLKEKKRTLKAYIFGRAKESHSHKNSRKQHTKQRNNIFKKLNKRKYRPRISIQPRCASDIKVMENLSETHKNLKNSILYKPSSRNLKLLEDKFHPLKRGRNTSAIRTMVRIWITKNVDYISLPTLPPHKGGGKGGKLMYASFILR